MGIQNLGKFLRTQCPQVYKATHLSKFAYKKIAIDVSLFMCKYKYACRDDWLNGFLRLVQALRANDVHCVFVYDGGAPPEKDKEREARAQQRRKTEDNITKIEADFDTYLVSGTVAPSLVNLQKRLHKQTKRKFHSLLDPESKEIDTGLLGEAVADLRNGLVKISSADFELTRKLCHALGVPTVQATLEAEATCFDLCKRGVVDAVLTEDTDVLAYGAHTFLPKIDVFGHTCVQVNYNEVLECLDMSSDEFLDLCIMCGCDYNSNIPKVGPPTAYKLLKKYGNVERIATETGKDISCLNYEKTKDLFRNPTVTHVDYVKYCSAPNYSLLKELMPHVNIDNIKRAFQPSLKFVE